MILVPILSARFKPIQNQANVVILKSKYLIGDRSNGAQPNRDSNSETPRQLTDAKPLRQLAGIEIGVTASFSSEFNPHVF